MNLNIKWISAGVLAVVALLLFAMSFTVLDAKHVMVIQYPNGALKAYTEPGPYMQWFGHVTKYERRAEYRFGKDTPLRVRFNDGGHADLIGAISWEVPTKPEQLIRLQKDFASQSAIEQQLVARALNNAVYFTGPLMSSTESTGERRGELLQAIDDQARNGVYQTATRQEKTKDPITGQEKTVAVVELVRGKDGAILRSAGSAIGDYGIALLPPSVNEITYDKVVESQIAERQKSITQVQIALANAKRAEQDALTAAKQGEANAAKAKWEQETIKAKEVTKAEQELAVATLTRQAAEQVKQKDILLGQGEAERKRLVMSADGALDQKLRAYVEVSGLYAKAMAEYKGAWVPAISMGGQSGTSNGANQLVDLLTAKTARDLGIDLSVNGREATKK